MVVSIDDLKSVVNKRNGLAKQNQFMVQLPAIGGVSLRIKYYVQEFHYLANKF